MHVARKEVQKKRNPNILPQFCLNHDDIERDYKHALKHSAHLLAVPSKS
jgi:hypothetical protein